MELLRYVANNILKRPVRTFFVVIAGFLSSFVLIFAFALGSRVTTHIKTDTIAKWTGHLWISRADDFEFKEEDLPRYEEEARTVREYLSGHPNTAILVPWYTGGCTIQAGTTRDGVGLCATDLQKDAPFTEQTELVSGRIPGPEDEYGVVVSTVMAKKYKLSTGSSITVFLPTAFGARNAMDFIVTGIQRPSAPWYDDQIVVRIEDLQSMLELGDAFPFYKAYVKDEHGIPAMVKELSAGVKHFQVKGYQDDDFVRFLLSLGTSNILFFGFMAMIIFMALLIGIRSIILTNIFDRREEIGTLRALGYPRGIVRNLFFGESLAALLLGYLLGAAAVGVIGAYFGTHVVTPPLLMLQYMFGMTRMAVTLDAFTLTAPLFILLLTLLATTLRTVAKETEKQAVSQMANR
jgi:ABC-type lipoprotein release transport system permease subunit